MSYVLGMDKIKEGESIEINCIYINNSGSN